MYYPLLRGKQFELKALREFSNKYPNTNRIVPIIEPVNKNLGPLFQGIDEMLANGLVFAIIMNPKIGDFKHDTVHFDLIEQKPELLEHRDDWIPAYLVNKDSAKILQLIEESQDEEVMLVIRSAIDLDDENTHGLLFSDKVGYIVHDFNASSRRVKSQLLRTGKRIIELNDCFVSKKRNADYLEQEDELFSESPFYYNEDGFYGFSDYTALPSEYVEGGMLPYAIAIHLTYKKAEDQIFVHHFVSDTNLSQSDPKRKFREAAKKVEVFFAGKPHTDAVNDIIERVNDSDGYPGLGYLKKLSISNHLELMNGLLSGEV